MALQKAFHLMRSGAPGPGADRPSDRRPAGRDRVRHRHLCAAAGLQAGDHAGPGRKGAGRCSTRPKRPLIVAGGGIINADASDLLVEFAEITGVPVIPTLMGWGTIPDDHRLMAGMCGLQTSHRYGNATMLASDFVLGIGNRWANRHTGTIEKYTGRQDVRSRRHRADTDRPRLRAGLRHRLGCRRGAEDAARRRHRMEDGGKLRDWSGWAEECQQRKRTMKRKTHFDQVPLKPQRVYEEMNKAFWPRHLLRHDDRPVADRRGAVPACLQAAQLDQLRAGRAARLDAAGSTRRARRRCGPGDRRAVGRLRFPVPDRGAGRRRPAQAALSSTWW